MWGLLQELEALSEAAPDESPPASATDDVKNKKTPK